MINSFTFDDETTGYKSRITKKYQLRGIVLIEVKVKSVNSTARDQQQLCVLDSCLHHASVHNLS